MDFCVKSFTVLEDTHGPSAILCNDTYASHLLEDTHGPSAILCTDPYASHFYTQKKMK